MHVQCHQTHRFSLWRCERVSPCHVPCLLRVCWQDFRLSVAASCKGAQDLTTHRAPCRSGEGLWPGSLAEIYGSKKDSAQQNCWDMLNLTQWCSYLSIRRPFKLNESIFIFIDILLTFLVNICFDKSNWNTRAEVRQSTYELPLWSNWNVSRQLLITCTLLTYVYGSSWQVTANNLNMTYLIRLGIPSVVAPVETQRTKVRARSQWRFFILFVTLKTDFLEHIQLAK